MDVQTVILTPEGCAPFGLYLDPQSTQRRRIFAKSQTKQYKVHKTPLKWTKSVPKCMQICRSRRAAVCCPRSPHFPPRLRPPAALSTTTSRVHSLLTALHEVLRKISLKTVPNSRKTATYSNCKPLIGGNRKFDWDVSIT